MRALSLFLCVLASLVFAQDAEEKLNALQASLAALTARLDDFETAGIHLYKDRSTCPDGFYPMESAAGRFLLLDGEDRGGVSSHTFKDTKILTLPCSKTIGVPESGFADVCSGSAEGTPIPINLENFVPYMKVLGCIKSKGPNPVI
jgi:hypothetical protein